MPLVAPGVQVHWREKDSIGRMEDQASVWKIFGNSQARRKAVPVGVHQPSRVPQLAADENGRNAIVENKVRIGVLLVVERACVFVADAGVDGRLRRHLPTVFGKRRRAPRAQIHLRYAGLALLHRRQAKQQAGQTGAAAIVEAKFGCVASCVLVVAAILEESPHRPDIPVKFTAEFHGMAAALPCIDVPRFDRCVPGMHRRCCESVTDSRVSLNGEPGSAPGVLAPEPDSLNAQRADNIVDSVILRGAVHRKTRNRKRDGIDSVVRKNMVPGPDRLLREVVKVHAKTGQIFRCGSHAAARGESVLSSGRVANQQGVSVREIVVHAKRALVLEVRFIAHVEVVAGIRSPRRHHHVRHRQILQQKAF